MVENTPLIQHFPYLGLFILLILGTLGLPFPEDGILLLSGFLTANQVIKPLLTLLILYSGLLTTDLSYFKAEEEKAKFDVVPLPLLLMLRRPLFKSENFPKGKLQSYAGVGPGC
jgi:hypothetical protein